jgi:uncharacterized protein (DUF4415 family)
MMNDKDNPEWTESMITQARPAREALPESFFNEMKKLRGQRGEQKAPKKVPVSLRLDAEIVEAYKATGKGWQSRINDVLLNNLPPH